MLDEILSEIQANGYKAAFASAAGFDVKTPVPYSTGFPVRDGKKVVEIWAYTRKDSNGMYWSFRIVHFVWATFDQFEPHKQKQAARKRAEISARLAQNKIIRKRSKS